MCHAGNVRFQNVTVTILAKNCETPANIHLGMKKILYKLCFLVHWIFFKRARFASSALWNKHWNNLLQSRLCSESKLLWQLTHPEGYLSFGTKSWGYPFTMSKLTQVSHITCFLEYPTDDICDLNTSCVHELREELNVFIIPSWCCFVLMSSFNLTSSFSFCALPCLFHAHLPFIWSFACSNHACVSRFGFVCLSSISSSITWHCWIIWRSRKA